MFDFNLIENVWTVIEERLVRSKTLSKLLNMPEQKLVRYDMAEIGILSYPLHILSPIYRMNLKRKTIPNIEIFFSQFEKFLYKKLLFYISDSYDSIFKVFV